MQRPGVARTEAAHLDPQRVTELLAAAEDSRYHTALLLIAATGLRRGECLALRWSDVDLDAGALRVRDTVQRIDGKVSTGPVKTDRSRRTIPLPPALVALLRRHRVTQLEERMRAANQWTDTGLVFTTDLGHVVEPRNLLRVVEAAAKRIDLDGVGAHTLRHSAATAWLRGGCAHQASLGFARALICRDHRRRVRPRVGPVGACRRRRPEWSARPLGSRQGSIRVNGCLGDERSAADLDPLNAS